MPLSSMTRADQARLCFGSTHPPVHAPGDPCRPRCATRPLEDGNGQEKHEHGEGDGDGADDNLLQHQSMPPLQRRSYPGTVSSHGTPMRAYPISAQEMVGALRRLGARRAGAASGRGSTSGAPPAQDEDRPTAKAWSGLVPHAIAVPAAAWKLGWLRSCW